MVVHKREAMVQMKIGHSTLKCWGSGYRNLEIFYARKLLKGAISVVTVEQNKPTHSPPSTLVLHQWHAYKILLVTIQNSHASKCKLLSSRQCPGMQDIWPAHCWPAPQPVLQQEWVQSLVLSNRGTVVLKEQSRGKVVWIIISPCSADAALLQLWHPSHNKLA